MIAREYFLLPTRKCSVSKGKSHFYTRNFPFRAFEWPFKGSECTFKGFECTFKGLERKKALRKISFSLRPNFYFLLQKNYFSISATTSSAASNFCSPVIIFFSITLPSAISVSPAIATKGMDLAFAYCICFFILTLSG